ISPTAQQVLDLKAGLHYFNVHTSNFTGGEIRGQLLWNPLNEPVYLVTQHYYDFLGRLPDPGGLNFWLNELTVCGTSVQCLRDRSVGVSNAFFYEQEYQQTASFVFLLYRAAYGDAQPFPNPDPGNVTEANKLPRYLTFVRDRAQVVGGSELAATQQALANAFVQRPEFVTKYPLSLATGAQFVDAVLATIQSASGVTLAMADRDALITHFNNGGRGLVMFHLANDYWNGCDRLNPPQSAPCVPAGFGAAVDNRVFIDAEYNRSFVYSQYSGYFRRDADIGGFLFWLNQVSQAPPRNVAKQHAMVCAQITSAEYQFRFGDTAPRTDAECIP
ncbi:MAG: CHRD domain-containing protein, partial [Pyrinomonadaceae bacterium]